MKMDDKIGLTYDLMEQREYLYVRVVKARDMPIIFDGVVELVAEVKLGNYSEITKTCSLGNIEWDQVFAFSKEYCIQSSTLEIIVKDIYEENHLGRIRFDLSNVPSRVPSASQLAPQWYKMEDKTKTGELMASIWFGTQDDEAFSLAWNSPNVPFDALSLIESKVYHSPKLWYLRVSVIEAEHIMPGHKGPQVVRFPEFYAKVQVGNHCLGTKFAAPSATRSFSNPYWDEDLLFVVEEPFVDSILIHVVDQVEPRSDVALAVVELPLATIEKRFDERPVTSSWFNLKSHCGEASDNNKPSTRFVPRIHLRFSLDGGYHVFDEVTMNSSDVRPTETSLWKPHIGMLEIQVIGASGLMPVKKIRDGEENVANAYCVAKYGPKWFRTRTVFHSLSPEWNEQYRWEIYDLCTVMTIGVFDNRSILKNVRASDYGIGKVRITLSKLETNRVYTQSYPLLMIHPSCGVKKTGELHLRIRLSCSSVTNMLHMYTMPLLPKMHYVDPLTTDQLKSLRFKATDLLEKQLSKEEPPLGKEIVWFMLDEEMWNMRRSKANYFRLCNAFSGLIAMTKSLQEIRDWQKPLYSTLLLTIFLILVMLPGFILPTILLYLAFIGLRSYAFRPRHPTYMDTRLSCAEMIHPDELDEEFDTFPTTRRSDIVRMRYDRLRSIAGRVQGMMGDAATHLERCEALINWTDPRATLLFMVLCLVAAVGFYVVPIRVVVALLGLYLFRPPLLRSKFPSAFLNFFRRLPTAEGCSEWSEWINEWTCLSVLVVCLWEDF